MPAQCATCGAGDALLFGCEYCDRQFCAEHVFPRHACDHPTDGAEGSDAGTGTGAAGTEEGVFVWGAGAPGTGRSNTAEADGASEGGGPDASSASASTSGDTATADADGFAGSGFTPAGALAPAPPDPRDPGDGTPAVRPAPVEPRALDGRATPAVRDATPDPRPVDRTGRPATRPTTGRLPERRDPSDDPEPLLAGGGAGASLSTRSGTDAGGSSPPIRSMDMDRSPGRAERTEPRTVADWLRQQTYVSLAVKTGALAAVINAALYFGMLLATSGLLERLLA